MLAEGKAERSRLSEILLPIAARLWIEPAAIPQDDYPDVIVTDRPSGVDVAKARFPQLAAAEAGIIAIGEDDGADVSLPNDCPARELELATLLLAEVVRLRRRERQNSRLGKELSLLAMSDPLTGLPNRRAWEEELRSRARNTTEQGSVCLVIFDLDHFKRINDERGHEAGDAALQAAASALAGSVRQHDFVARLGGDEFAVLLADLNEETATAVVERVRAALGHQLRASPVGSVTGSAGYAIWRPAQGQPAEKVLARADQALRQAKQAGRDQTCAAPI